MLLSSNLSYDTIAEVYASHPSRDSHSTTACENALAQATHFSSRGDSEHDPYWTCFDQLLMYGYQGTCYLKLRQPEAAKKALTQALQLSDPHNIYHQAVLHIDLATAYQQQGDITNACLRGHSALTIVGQTYSPILWQRIEAFRSNFPAGQTEGTLQIFDEHKASVQQLIFQQTHFDNTER